MNGEEPTRKRRRRGHIIVRWTRARVLCVSYRLHTRRRRRVRKQKLNRDAVSDATAKQPPFWRGRVCCYVDRRRCCPLWRCETSSPLACVCVVIHKLPARPLFSRCLLLPLWRRLCSRNTTIITQVCALYWFNHAKYSENTYCFMCGWTHTWCSASISDYSVENTSCLVDSSRETYIIYSNLSDMFMVNHALPYYKIYKQRVSIWNLRNGFQNR